MPQPQVSTQPSWDRKPHRASTAVVVPAHLETEKSHQSQVASHDLVGAEMEETGRQLSQAQALRPKQALPGCLEDPALRRGSSGG